MEILTVKRKRYNAYHIETIIKDKQGKEVYKNLTMLNQLRKGTKTMVLKGVKYLLNWSE